MTDTSRMTREQLEDRSFCGRASCPCAHDDATPCEEFQPYGRRSAGFFAPGRCARCGNQASEHDGYWAELGEVRS